MLLFDATIIKRMREHHLKVSASTHGEAHEILESLGFYVVDLSATGDDVVELSSTSTTELEEWARKI